jgi:hypothetical protein
LRGKTPLNAYDSLQYIISILPNISTYMIVYYIEYIVYQIYLDIYGNLLYRIYSLPNIH